MAPKVVLSATHSRALEICSLESLTEHAVVDPERQQSGDEEGDRQ
jgi:hypothetical protein